MIFSIISANIILCPAFLLRVYILVYMCLFNDYIVNSSRARIIGIRHQWDSNTRSLILELTLIISVALKTGKGMRIA